jgi:hypothetical protein
MRFLVKTDTYLFRLFAAEIVIRSLLLYCGRANMVPSDWSHSPYWVTSMPEFLERIKSIGMVINGSLKWNELTFIRPKNFTPSLLDSVEGCGIRDTHSVSIHIKIIASLRVAG